MRRRRGMHGRLSRLQAGVLGANDGIISVAAIAVGVAGATSDAAAILPATLAALVGGATSIAVSEYVSVSAQYDAETALIARERAELVTRPRAKLDELAEVFVDYGLPLAEARQVAADLTARDALGAHLRLDDSLDPDDIVSPGRAAAATASGFVAGAVLPILTILLPPEVRVPATFLVVLAALILTGLVSARIGGGRPARGTARIVAGGVVALGVTFAAGTLLRAVGLVG